MSSKDRAIAELGITADLYEGLVAEFVPQTRQRLSDMDAAWARHDTRRLTELAHGLKGVAANLRIDEMAEEARCVVALCRENRDQDGVTARLERLRVLLDGLQS